MVNWYNIIDDKGRFVGFKTDNKGDGQYNSHTYSYIFIREMEKLDPTELIGLEAVLEWGDGNE